MKAKLFENKKPIIGMIHLAGNDSAEKIERAIEEIKIYRNNGVDGIIVEDYHGSKYDVHSCLERIGKDKSILGNLVLGINLLCNPYSSFMMANSPEDRASFVQFDNINSSGLDEGRYNVARAINRGTKVFGGVRFKYQRETGRSLEEDIAEAMARCDVIVTTGSGTGVETPIQKLKDFKKIAGEFPVFVGAGLNAKNAYEQLSVADGAIVGSYFKFGEKTENNLDVERVREIVGIRNKVL
jgi:uncharacterized protein